MHDSVGVINSLGKTLIVENGYSLVKINNVALGPKGGYDFINSPEQAS